MADEQKTGDEVGNDLELGHTVSEGLGDGMVVTPMNVTVNAVATAGYHRKLTKRQIMMMTFGAGIGTGLWVGTGQALRGGMLVEYNLIKEDNCLPGTAGPGGIAIAYSLQSCAHLSPLTEKGSNLQNRFIVWSLYMSIGEMTTYRPVHGGFIRQAAEYVDPALAFAEGVNFWFQV